MNYSASDIPYELAYQAYTGSSFSPEKRAVDEQNSYVRHMDEMVKKYGHLPGAEAELERYRTGYTKHLCAVLQAKSRTLSPMITGPSKFPYARNDKHLAAEDKRIKEFMDWQTKAVHRMERNLGLRRIAISSDDPNAIGKLEQKLTALQKQQETMKAANKAARKEVREQPYPAYLLTNNNSNIRRIRQRIDELQTKSQEETMVYPFPGGKIIDNVEDNRLQIVFDSKPDADTRALLKSHGFRWAPSVGVWQRHRTTDAMWAAKRIGWRETNG